MLRRKIFITIAIFCLSFSFTPVSHAGNASLYLSPSSGTYTVGNTFSVAIKVNTGGIAINAGEGSLVFPPDKLEVVSISKSESIFNLWTTEPTFSNSSGTINFGGGAPQPGYTGAAGTIITATFKAKIACNVNVNFSSGAILANDGQGTNILSSLGSANYIIKAKTTITQPPIEQKPKEQTPIIKETKETEQPTIKTEITKPEITSSTHPDQNAWYNNNDIKFKWELPYGITGVSILLNEKPDSNPGPVSDGLFSIKDYENIEDGIWYLHIKFKQKRDWSEIEHFKIQIDTEPPEQFKIEVEQKRDLEWPILHFKTKDRMSGISRYEIKINGEDFIANSDQPMLSVPALAPGKYTTIVKAVDKAGNERLAIADFVISALEAPIIKNYNNELKPNDLLFIGGTALPDVAVNIFIQNAKTDKIIEQTVQSDEKGDWHLVYKDSLTDGKYFAWAQAINSQGLRSETSGKISFLVAPSAFVIFGSWVINYFTVFVSLLLFMILVIAFLAYWAGSVRNRLKKEVNEAQVILHKNLKELKKLMEKEINSLNKNNVKGRQTIKTKRILNSRTNFIEKKIAKEIQDIKNLLK